MLEDARGFITPPEAWSKYWLAQDASGQRVLHATDEDAVSWCAAGAICKAAGVPHCSQIDGTEAGAAFDLLDQMHGTSQALGNANDNASHEQVLGWFDRAIEACQLAEGA